MASGGKNEDQPCWSSGLYMNKNGVDLTLVFGSKDEEQVKLQSHSFVLSPKSPVLKAIITSTNFRQNPKKEIQMTGVKLQVADVFFRYLYFEELPVLGWSSLVALNQAALKYQLLKLEDLTTECLDDIYSKEVTLDNVCQKYEESVEIGCLLSETNDPCLQLMAQGAQILFTKELHLILSSESLALFLALDNLNVEDESVVLEALWKWGEKQCIACQIAQSAENVIHEIEPFLVHIRWAFVPDREDSLRDLVLTERLKNRSQPFQARKKQDRPSLLAKSEVFGASKKVISFSSAKELVLIGSLTFSKNVFLTGLRLKVLEYKFLTDREYRFAFDLDCSGVRLVFGKMTKEVLESNDTTAVMNIYVEFKPPFLMLAERKVKISFDDVYFFSLFKTEDAVLESFSLNLNDKAGVSVKVQDASPSLRDVFYIS